MYWRLLICCAGLGLWLGGCASRGKTSAAGSEKLVLARRSQPLLGTFVTISVYAGDQERGQEAISAAFEEIRRVDLLLSIHKAESEISRVNREAAAGPVEISEELRFVLASALQIAEETEGAFDPTIGPLARLWGFIWKEYRLPTKAELERVLPLVGYKMVMLSTNTAGPAAARPEVAPRPGNADATLRFAKAGMFLDFGGIGKGYAVDRAVAVLKEHGIRNAMVKAGGDLRVMGSGAGEDEWEVQIEDPRKEGKRTTLRLREGALSTSGNYENYFEVGGRRYSHIIDPRTGLPVQGIASCTVTAQTCLESDAYATAFFVMGVENATSRFGERFGIRFVEDEELNGRKQR